MSHAQAWTGACVGMGQAFSMLSRPGVGVSSEGLQKLLARLLAQGYEVFALNSGWALPVRGYRQATRMVFIEFQANKIVASAHPTLRLLYRTQCQAERALPCGVGRHRRPPDPSIVHRRGDVGARERPLDAHAGSVRRLRRAARAAIHRT